MPDCRDCHSSVGQVTCKPTGAFSAGTHLVPWGRGVLLCCTVQFSSVQLLNRVQPFAAPGTVAHKDSLSITSSRSLLKLMSVKSMMPSNHLIFCHPFFLLCSIFPSIKIFSNESVLHIRWPKNWSFSFSISPSN